MAGIREEILPTTQGEQRFLYDLTEEKPLGRLRPVRCDLEKTTVRVYGIVTAELTAIDLRCRQQLSSGNRLPVSVSFLAKDGRRLAGVLPFQLTLLRPDGKPQIQWYRGTDRQGSFAAELPIPLNVPQGDWKLEARCQLNGLTATIPLKIVHGQNRSLATALTEAVVVRRKRGHRPCAGPRGPLVLPLFEKQQELADVAEQVKTRLAAQGITVDILTMPEMATYWLAYDLTPQQKAENARVEKGEAIGRVKRLTANGNDWFGGSTGYWFPRPLILLDVAGAKGNELARALESQGMLWPEVGPAFPGSGRGSCNASPGPSLRGCQRS